MSGLMSVSFQHLQHLSPPAALPTVAGLMLVESLGAPTPSEIILPAAGWWARHAHFAPVWAELVVVFVACTIGSMVGCCIAYAIGHYGGRPLVMKFGRYLLITPHHLDRAEKWLEGKGAWAIAVGRLIVAVRALISYPAGAARMPFARFLMYSLLGVSVFDAVLIGVGYQYGDRITSQLHHWGLEIGVAAGVVIVGLLIWWWWKEREVSSPPA